MVEVGKTYYLILHAYHHVIAKVKVITGKREADLEFVTWVYRSQRNWTQFFAEGIGEEGVTTYHRFPNAHGTTWIGCFDWPHPNPSEDK